MLQPGASIVFGVGVAPAFRRRGVATALMRAWANAAADRALFLQILEDNGPGLALYDRLGFTLARLPLPAGPGYARRPSHGPC